MSMPGVSYGPCRHVGLQERAEAELQAARQRLADAEVAATATAERRAAADAASRCVQRCTSPSISSPD